MRLAVVVPTYIRAENIPELFGRCFSALAGLNAELIVVDDSSPDGTAHIAESLGRLCGNVKVVRRPRRAGLASAVLEGARSTDADIIAVIDGDLQHLPELLPVMYSLILRGYDLVIASRYIEGSKIEEWSISRKLMSQIATTVVHALFPRTRGIRDILSGYFMVRRHLLNKIKVKPLSFKIPFFNSNKRE